MDYLETLGPLAILNRVKTSLLSVANVDLNLHQFNVNDASFLSRGDLEEEIHIKI